MQARASEQNRIEKHLQISGVKLSSVTSKVFRVSATDMLEHIADGSTDPDALAELARGRLRKTKDALKHAFGGPISEHTQQLIGFQLDELERITRTITSVESRIMDQTQGLTEQIALLDSIPGINLPAAIDILAEIGTDMSPWTSHRQIAAMAGVCPGNFISAGERLKNRSRQGNPYLKTALVQAATSAVNCNGSYFQAKYKRLKQSRGHKRAILAIAHALLVTIYHMLKRGEPYRDLGPHHPAQVDQSRKARSLVLQLERLGFHVELATMT